MLRAEFFQAIRLAVAQDHSMNPLRWGKTRRALRICAATNFTTRRWFGIRKTLRGVWRVLAADATIGAMLAPQFSLRTVLIVTAVCGVISLIGGAAVRGSPMAAALVMALTALVLMIAVHGMIFFAVWVFSQLFTSRRRAAAVGSPFAAAPLTGGGVATKQTGDEPAPAG